jgi:hypothetical protein
MRRYVWVPLVLAIGLLVVAAWHLCPSRDAARDALDAFLAVPAGPEAHYPQRRAVHRFRAWMLTTPYQPDGIDVFEALPDVVFDPEQSINEHELRSALHGIIGCEWDESRNAWKTPAGGLILASTIRERLDVVSPSPAETRAVLGLLTGQPAPGLAEILKRMQRGEYPRSVQIRQFHGLRGQLTLDLGVQTSRVVERAYAGCLLRFDGPGWPEVWKIAELKIIGR